MLEKHGLLGEGIIVGAECACEEANDKPLASLKRNRRRPLGDVSNFAYNSGKVRG